MRKLLLILFFLSVGLQIQVTAQTAARYVSMGDKSFRDGDYYAASGYYLQAVKMDSTKLQYLEKLADANRMFNNYEAAAQWYGSLLKKANPGKYAEAEFWYGVVLRNRNMYREALRIFEQINPQLLSRKSMLLKRLEQEKKACTWALMTQSDSVDVILNHLPKQLNTSYNEFNPVQLKDSVLIFSSIRLDQETDPQEGVLPGTYLSRIYASPKTPAGFASPEPFARQINEPGFHNSNITFSADLKTAWFSRCEDKTGDVNTCRLYQSKFRNGKWQKAYPLDDRFAMPGYTFTQPDLAHTEKEDILFFVSDRPGGQGGKDIWYSVLKKNRLQDPVNLGPPVNTPGDELCPFYHAESGQLYFSSDWHEGYGGYDIFRSKGNYNQWSKPENVRKPFNSEANDLYFRINTDDSSGYLTSNRRGSFFIKSSTCCNDNYFWYFRPVKPLKDTVRQEKTDSISLEMQVRQYLPLNLYFHNDIPRPGLSKESTDVAYNTTVAEYYLMKSRYLQEYSKGLQGNAKNVASQEINDFFEHYVIKGLKQLDELSALLLRDLESGTQVSLTIAGFTSPLNSDSYNKLLSKRRIASLVNYFSQYEGGRMKPYIGNSDDAGLKIFEEPLGEEKSNPQVSDNPNDLRNSVYSRSAALERRIQITGYIRKEAKSIHRTQPTEKINNPATLTTMTLDKDFIDLGALRAGNNARTEVLITNNGQSVLRIIALETSCGCTVVDWPKEEILPGKSAVLKIYFDSRNKSGEQFEQISLKANIPESEKTIVVRAFIK